MRAAATSGAFPGLILYLDTSALVKLYAEEAGSDEVREAVGDARATAVSEICYVEARSALARREREGFFSEEEHDLAAEQLRRDFEEVYVLRPVTGGIVSLAGDLARRHALRAYDAVHLATALDLREEARGLADLRPESAEEGIFEDSDELETRLMSYDSSLNKAARKEDLAHEPKAPPPRTEK